MDTSVDLVKRVNLGHQPLVVVESDKSFFSKNTKPFFFFIIWRWWQRRSLHQLKVNKWEYSVRERKRTDWEKKNYVTHDTNSTVQRSVIFGFFQVMFNFFRGLKVLSKQNIWTQLTSDNSLEVLSLGCQTQKRFFTFFKAICKILF